MGRDRAVAASTEKPGSVTDPVCHCDGSRFREGFETSARLVLKWKPDILVNGHGTHMRFAASQFQKIIRWSRRAEATTKALCPRQPRTRLLSSEGVSEKYTGQVGQRRWYHGKTASPTMRYRGGGGGGMTNRYTSGYAGDILCRRGDK